MSGELPAFDLSEHLKRLALAIEPALELQHIPASARSNERYRITAPGLEVDEGNPVDAWKAALEAAQKRAAWRARKLEGKARP